MYPLTNSLRRPLEIFLSDDTIRPDYFIEFISKKRPHDPRPLLVSLFNHVRSCVEKELRHVELEFALMDVLTKKHFVQILPDKPAILTKKCFVQTLSDDGWVHVAAFLKFKSLAAFSATCRRFRDIGHVALTLDSRNIQKLMQRTLGNSAYVPRPFKEEQYNRPYDLTLAKVRSVAALQQFPGVQTLKVLDANITQDHFRGLVASLPYIVKLHCSNLRNVTPELFAACSIPSSLKSCTLIGSLAEDATVRALAKKCPHLEELVIHSGRLTFAAFSGKTPMLKLRSLELFSAKLLSDVDMRHILSCCPGVRCLKVNHCENLTCSTLAEFEGLEFLEELDVQGTNITSTLFKIILARAKNLRRLTIGFCDHISEQAFKDVVYPATLTHFSAQWTKISDGGLRHLLDSANLESLDLTSCTSLTNRVFNERPWLRGREHFQF